MSIDHIVGEVEHSLVFEGLDDNLRAYAVVIAYRDAYL